MREERGKKARPRNRGHWPPRPPIWTERSPPTIARCRLNQPAHNGSQRQWTAAQIQANQVRPLRTPKERTTEVEGSNYQSGLRTRATVLWYSSSTVLC